LRLWVKPYWTVSVHAFPEVEGWRQFEDCARAAWAGTENQGGLGVLSVGPAETVEHGFLPGLSRALRQYKDGAMHGCASGEGGAIELAKLTDYQRTLGIGTVGAALETVERFIGRGLRGAGAGHKNRQRGEKHNAKWLAHSLGSLAAGRCQVIRHDVPP
jgi:hypothetical protein